MHNIMNEFEFRPDRTTNYGVSYPWASKKYPHRLIMGKMMFPLFLCYFLIGSVWYFHVTRTSIKAWMSSNSLKWDLTLAHWTQVSDRCPLGCLFFFCFVASATWTPAAEIQSKDIIGHFFQNGCPLNGKYVLSLKCHRHVICENISSKFSEILLRSYHFTWLAMTFLLQCSETA